MLTANVVLSTRVFVADKIVDVEGDNKLKHVKSKIRRSESQNLAKSQKLSKSEKFKDKKSKKPSKSENSPNFNTTEAKSSFLTPGARETFNHLQIIFTKAPIIRHFDPECHIWIEIDVLSYAIGDMLSQLVFKTRPDGVVTKTNLDQWNLVAFFSRKIILAETQYKTHNSELLAIIEAFKTWRYYLKSCKHKMFILMGHNNFYYFVDTKSLSSR